MKKTSEARWKSHDLDVAAIQLDPQNSRIEVAPDADQATIRAALLEFEQVVELANKIVESDGLLHGERIIVIRDKGGYTVVEGNRRVTACQVLLDPSLAAPAIRKRISGASDALKQRLKTIAADVAPSREAAEVTITKRHTEPGVLRWSPQANQRRIARLMNAGRSIEDVSAEFNMSPSGVRKLSREYNLLQHMRTLNVWSKAERKELGHPRLKTNPFTRFFSLAGAKETLKLTFDERGQPISGLGPGLFDAALERIARELLLARGSEGALNTRATAAEVFRKVFRDHPGLKALITKAGTAKTSKTSKGSGAGKKAGAAGGRNGPTEGNGEAGGGRPEGGIKVKAKADKFFESLTCPIQDNRLIQLTDEISTINYIDYPIAATFLVRALLERTLQYCVEEKQLWKTLMAEYMTNVGQAKGKPEPGLEFIIKFCINHRASIFIGNVKGVLDEWLARNKTICDLVVHGKWLDANESRLLEVASGTRPFILGVFQGNALLP